MIDLYPWLNSTKGVTGVIEHAIDVSLDEEGGIFYIGSDIG